MRRCVQRIRRQVAGTRRRRAAAWLRTAIGRKTRRPRPRRRRESRRRRPGLGLRPTSTRRPSCAGGLRQRIAPTLHHAVLPIDRPTQEFGQRGLQLLLHPCGRLFELLPAPARAGMRDPMHLARHPRAARARVVAQHPGQRPVGRPRQAPVQRGVRRIGHAHQSPAGLHRRHRCMSSPVAAVGAEQGRRLCRRQRQHDRVERCRMAFANGLHLPAEPTLVQAVDGKGTGGSHSIHQVATQRRHVRQGHIEPIATLEWQIAGGLHGRPIGQPTRAKRLVDERLESLGAGRDADGTVVEPRRTGLPLSVDPFKAAGSQATPWPAGLVEHVYRMAGDGERARASGPSDTGADHRD